MTSSSGLDEDSKRIMLSTMDTTWEHKMFLCARHKNRRMSRCLTWIPTKLLTTDAATFLLEKCNRWSSFDLPTHWPCVTDESEDVAVFGEDTSFAFRRFWPVSRHTCDNFGFSSLSFDASQDFTTSMMISNASNVAHILKMQSGNHGKLLEDLLLLARSVVNAETPPHPIVHRYVDLKLGSIICVCYKDENAWVWGIVVCVSKDGSAGPVDVWVLLLGIVTTGMLHWGIVHNHVMRVDAPFFIVTTSPNGIIFTPSSQNPSPMRNPNIRIVCGNDRLLRQIAMSEHGVSVGDLMDFMWGAEHVEALPAIIRLHLKLFEANDGQI